MSNEHEENETRTIFHKDEQLALTVIMLAVLIGIFLSVYRAKESSAPLVTDSDTSVRIRGEAEPGELLTVYQGDEAIGTTQADENGSWTYTFTDSQPSANDLASLAVLPFAQTADTTNRSGISSSILLDFLQNISLDIASDPNAMVAIAVNDKVIDMMRLNYTGQQTYEMPYEAITVGLNEITVRNTDTDTLIFSQTVNRSAPAATRLDSTPAQGSVTGTGQPNGLIAIQFKRQPIQLINTDSTGNWQASPLVNTDTEYDVSVWSIDTNNALVGTPTDSATVTLGP